MAFDWLPKQETLARAADAALITALASSRNWIVSGLSLGVPGSGLSPTITTGTAWIDGYVVTLTGETVAVTDNATSTVYLGLSVDGNDNVTGIALSITIPASGYYVTLGTVTAASGNISGTGTTGRSPITQGGANWGEIAGTLSSQTDLQTALNGKVSTTGNESIDGIKTFTSVPVVPNDSFAFAKLQNIATARILGRSTALSGDIEELTAAQVLTLLGIVPPRANANTAAQTITLGTNENVTNLVINSGLVNSTAYAFDVTIICGRTGTDANSNLLVNFLLSNVTNIYGGLATTYESEVGYSDDTADFTTDLTALFWATTGTNKATVRISGRFITAASGTPSVQLRCKMSNASGYDTIIRVGSNIRAIPI
jgi:hypothetical protein